MSNMIEFLTSKEIIVVYIIIAAAILLCLILFIIDKTYDKRRKRQNTRKLNKLVEEVNLRLEKEKPKKEVKKEVKVSEVEEVVDPVIVEPEVEVSNTINSVNVESDFVPPIEVDVEPDTSAFEDEIEVMEEVPMVHEKVEELLYTDPEPDREEATRELLKLTEELEKAEREQKNEIDIDAYESLQEENAIISLDELTKRSEEMYAANEVTQYEDEGNEPISLEDLERRKQEVINSEINEEPEIIEVEEPEIIEEIHQEQLDLDNAYHGHNTKSNNEIFSSVFGAEKQKVVQTEEELEKTSQFLLSIKDLQEKLKS